MGTASYYRIEGIQQFENVRRRAQFYQFGMKLFKQPLTLLPFDPIYERLSSTNGFPRGIQEIPVLQVVGSLGRAGDFDRHFRPLRDSQRERWVDVWVRHKLNGWNPITVRQVSNLFFVEDGHHRASVARALKLSSLPAYVTEYPLNVDFELHASLASTVAAMEELAIEGVAPSTAANRRLNCILR